MESANKIKKQINAICKEIQNLQLFTKNRRLSYKSMDFLNKKNIELNNKIDNLFKLAEFENGERVNKSKSLRLLPTQVKDVLIKYLGEDVFDRKYRKHNSAINRFCCMYFLRKYTDLAFEDIANMFYQAYKDHTSIVHGVDTFKNVLDKDEHWQIISKQIQTKLEQNVLTKLEQLRTLADAEIRQHNANTAESIPY